MNTTLETVHKPFRETGLKWVVGGSALEAIGALATMALAIVGLAGILSTTVTAIAVIILGAAILTQGGAFAAGNMTSGVEFETQMRPSGTSAAFLGGIAGIVLGILALLGIASTTLLAVAVIVFGATLFLGGGSAAQLAFTPSGGEIMVGLAAIVLGILSVVGLAQLTLVLVALLCLGAFALFGGSASGGQSVSAMNQ